MQDMVVRQIKFYVFIFRDGQKWFARTVLEEKDDSWKRDILLMVSEVTMYF
jgi:hypothetical protein